MKAMMPGAVFIGFTGTPLLKADKLTSLEVFGSYIHTYKYSEGVEDGVVLDLVYEARDVDQELGSQEKIDAWFEAKTRDLNDWQKDELRKQWGTMQRVLSSRSRTERIVNDIVFDFGVRPRLSNQRGTAMLVAASIFEACKYYALFKKTGFKGHCAVITSYNPQAADITLEDTGAANETDKQFMYNLYQEILKDIPTGRHDKHRRLRSSRETSLQERTGDDEAVDRRRQAADRLRRTELHLPLYRQVDARPRIVPGDLPNEPA